MSDQRPYQFEVKSIDEPARIIKVRLTDATKDRMRETIPLRAWKRPLPESIPINFGHDNSKPAIARGRNLQAREDGIYGDLHFPPRGISPEADLVFELLKLGILTDVSVEFLGRREGDTYVETELLAAGIVNIGANPRAQVVARALGFGATGRGAPATRTGPAGPVVLEIEETIDIDPAVLDRFIRTRIDQAHRGLRRDVETTIKQTINRLRGRVD